jgi:hypothetical protein
MLYEVLVLSSGGERFTIERDAPLSDGDTFEQDSEQGIELINDEGKPPPLALLLRRRPTRSSSSCATRADTRS